MLRTALLLLPLALIACGGSSGSNDPVETVAQEDFSLPDVNPTSATHNTNVSPRDQRGKVSAWYFGSAT